VHKLFGNAMIIGLGGTMADIVTMAGAAKVDAADAVKLIGMLDLNMMAARIGGAMAQRDFEPTFELAMARKDVGLMLQTAGDKPMAALPGVAARMDQLIAAGHGAKGTGVLAIDAGS
jgi:3-hydroxyisobutyrate dehydrogenase-like beta-hydroxyacid dehydrogenase